MQATFIFKDGSALTIDHVKELEDCGRDYKVIFIVSVLDDIIRERRILKDGLRIGKHIITPTLERIMQTGIPGELDRVIEVNGKEIGMYDVEGGGYVISTIEESNR